jgi:hypothetical protein
MQAHRIDVIKANIVSIEVSKTKKKQRTGKGRECANIH